MAAWRSYMEHVKIKPNPDDNDAHIHATVLKQTKLIYKMARDLGFKIDETDIQGDAYASDGFIKTQIHQIDALIAIKNIAITLDSQHKFLIAFHTNNKPNDPDAQKN